VLDVLGAAACALCVTALLWGRLAPLSGWVGFTVFAYVLFLIAYTVLTQLRADGPAVRDRLATVVMWSAAVILFGVLAFVVLFTLVRGWRALVHVNFFTQDMTFAGPLQPLSVGGIKHAIVGTLWMIGIALALTVPLGIACAVFLTQVGGIGARFVRMIVEAMTALPDVVAGLFIYATWVLILGFGRSGLAAALALATAVLPIITRAADVVLRVVPGSLREASEALGAPRWRTVWHVILPTARSGLATAVILGAARGIGETAPVLLTAGYTATMNTNPLSGPMVSLPLAVFEFVRSPQPAMIERGFAAAAFLMLLVLALFALGRVLGGRAPGHLTRGSAARAKRRSARDSARIASRQRYRDRYPDRVSTTVFPVPPGLTDPGGRS
jgi:phosphate transport system permease protein